MQYDILYSLPNPNVLQAPNWILASQPNQNFGNNLAQLLNNLAGKGWRVVATGEFGLSPQSEIIISHD